MKNKIILGMAIVAIAVVAVFNQGLGSKTNELSGVSLANVEALADELSEVTIECDSSYGECGMARGRCYYNVWYILPVCKWSGSQSDSCCLAMS